MAMKCHPAWSAGSHKQLQKRSFCTTGGWVGIKQAKVNVCWGKWFWRNIDTGSGYIKLGFLTVGTLAPPSPRSAPKRHSKTSVLFLCMHNCPDHRCDNLHLGHHQSREQSGCSMPMTDVPPNLPQNMQLGRQTSSPPSPSRRSAMHRSGDPKT